MNLVKYGLENIGGGSYKLIEDDNEYLFIFTTDMYYVYYIKGIMVNYGAEIKVNDIEQYIIDNELYSIQYRRNLKLKQLGI